MKKTVVWANMRYPSVVWSKRPVPEMDEWRNVKGDRPQIGFVGGSPIPFNSILTSTRDGRIDGGRAP